MSHDGSKERRASTRFPVRIRMAFADPAFQDETVPAETCDICIAGLGLITDKKLLTGIELNICLYMRDNGEEIKAKGKVVWTALTATGKYRVGVKLEEPHLKPIPMVLRILKANQL